MHVRTGPFLFSHSNSRHPEASERPAFSDILSALLDYEARVLFIPKEALETNPQAGVLGAPLEAGKGMYIVLQDSYFDYI